MKIFCFPEIDKQWTLQLHIQRTQIQWTTRRHIPIQRFNCTHFNKQLMKKNSAKILRLHRHMLDLCITKLTNKEDQNNARKKMLWGSFENGKWNAIQLKLANSASMSRSWFQSFPWLGLVFLGGCSYFICTQHSIASKRISCLVIATNSISIEP